MTSESKRCKRIVLLRAQGGLCFYCGRGLPRKLATLDHLIAQSRGGNDGIDNLVACCQTCNLAKGDREPTLAEWDRKFDQMFKVPWQHVRPELRNVIPCR